MQQVLQGGELWEEKGEGSPSCSRLWSLIMARSELEQRGESHTTWEQRSVVRCSHCLRGRPLRSSFSVGPGLCFRVHRAPSLTRASTWNPSSFITFWKGFLSEKPNITFWQILTNIGTNVLLRHEIYLRIAHLFALPVQMSERPFRAEFWEGVLVRLGQSGRSRCLNDFSPPTFGRVWTVS